MLVFVTLCALVCSWLAVRIKQARRQGEAVAVVHEMADRHVYYDWQFNYDGKLAANAIAPAPESLRKLLGDDFFADVTYLSLDALTERQADLPSLAALTRIKRLILIGPNISDVGISRLEALIDLNELVISEDAITDKALKRLQRALPNCKIGFFPADL
jgi:hypothetical protein